MANAIYGKANNGYIFRSSEVLQYAKVTHLEVSVILTCASARHKSKQAINN